MRKAIDFVVKCFERAGIGDEKMVLRVDDFLSRMMANWHYEYDRYDPDWPDFHSMIIADAILQALGALGLVDRIKRESGWTEWRATEALRMLVAAREVGEEAAADLEEQPAEVADDRD